MKVEFNLSIGLAGASRTEVVEVPDDFSEEDIEEEYLDWRNDCIEGYWKILGEVKND